MGPTGEKSSFASCFHSGRSLAPAISVIGKRIRSRILQPFFSSSTNLTPLKSSSTFSYIFRYEIKLEVSVKKKFHRKMMGVIGRKVHPRCMKIGSQIEGAVLKRSRRVIQYVRCRGIESFQVVLVSHCASEWTGWSSLICFLAGEASSGGAATSRSNNNENGNDDDRKTADKAGCNFIRQRRILIRIPPLDRANESRGQAEEEGAEGEAVFVR